MESPNIARQYVPLWCKSNFSFLEGASHPGELVDRAAALGLPALAVTDRNGLYGIVKAFDRLREIEKHSDDAPGTTPRGGTSGRGPAPRLIVGSQVSVDDGASLLLLVQNRTGYRNLCTLLSKGHLRSAKGQSSVACDELCARPEGLIALWLADGQPGEPGLLRGLREAYAGRLYAVVARHRWFDDVRLERAVRETSMLLDVPLVAATEVLYHTAARRRLQDVLVCIKNGVTLTTAGKLLKPNAEHALKESAEFCRLYRDDPRLIECTLEIADACTFSLAELEYRYPDEAVPAGYTTAQWLRKLTYEGARSRYVGDVPADVAAQLERELALVEELRYSGYFLTMWEIVRYCAEHGILCQGRGSAANSAVCYCLGITAIDPVRMDLLFERFISRERAEPPDIDIDIEHHRREEVIQHIYRKYGRDRAAMVANVVCYRTRSAVREVGKALGIQSTALDRCAKLLPHWEDRLEGVLAEAGLDLDLPVNQHLADLSREISGFPRHLSIHPGGFLLGSEPVSCIVPIENATMPGRTVIQWDKRDVESLNLFKVDLLGLGALTHLAYCFKLLHEHFRVDLALNRIPPNAPEVFEMIRRSDTVGVFQIESRAQMAMLPRLKPENYYDLVIEVSIVRPGPITGGMVHPYLRRRRGEEEVRYPHPKLEPILKKTLGVPLFQEQVMKLAVAAADYTPGEADQLRRDMAAWRSSNQIEKHKSRLVSRMIKNGIAAEFAERVFEQIRGFGEYGFPESHAASFALIAYATAWMKCHYPALFACALLNAWPMGFYFPSTIVEDAKRHGVPVLPIDLFASEWDCTLVMPSVSGVDVAGATQVSAAAPADRQPAIRMGVRYVKGLGTGDWEKITACRARRPATLGEFTASSGLDRDVLERLAESGALECLGVHRREALWGVLDSLPAGAGLTGTWDEQSPSFAALASSEKIAWDHVTSAHSTEGHLVEPFRLRLRGEGLPDAAALIPLPDGTMVSYAGLVICRQMPGTARNVFFMTLEDETGFANLVVWPAVFRRYRTMILTTSFLGVTGHLQSADGVVHIIAHSFWKPRVADGGSGPQPSTATRSAPPSHDFR